MKFIVKKYNRNSEEKPTEEHFVNQKQAESYIESLVKKAEKEGKIVCQTFQNDLVQGHSEPYGFAYRTINQIDEYRIASTKEDILDGGDVEMLSLYETEAEDIDDACSLTHAWLNDKSIESILAHAQIHIDDIFLYNPEHPAILLIKKLVKKTEELNREIDQILKELTNEESNEIKKAINWPIPREDVIARIVEEYRHDSENLFLQDVLSFGFEGFDSWDDEKLEREIEFLMNQKSTYDGFSIEDFLKSSY